MAHRVVASNKPLSLGVVVKQPIIGTDAQHRDTSGAPEPP